MRLLLLLLAAFGAAAASEGGPKCSRNVRCKNGGTCHLHTGQCVCPLYYGGPFCETPVYPACRLTVEKSHDGLPPGERSYFAAAVKAESSGIGHAPTDCVNGRNRFSRPLPAELDLSQQVRPVG